MNAPATNTRQVPIVLLAAGAGERYGGIKQLAQLDGEPMLRRVTRNLLSVGGPVIVVTGALLSMAVFISATTKIVDRASGQINIGKVPPYSVVVPGNIGGGPDRPSTYCAVIVKTVDERTRSKTSINELLRD